MKGEKWPKKFEMCFPQEGRVFFFFHKYERSNESKTPQCHYYSTQREELDERGHDPILPITIKGTSRPKMLEKVVEKTPLEVNQQLMNLKKSTLTREPHPTLISTPFIEKICQNHCM